MPARPAHRTPTTRLGLPGAPRRAPRTAPLAPPPAEAEVARAWARFEAAACGDEAVLLAAIDAAYTRLAGELAGFAEARTALTRFPRLSDHTRPALHGGLEAMYRAALAQAASLDDVLALMVFEGGYHCYDFHFPAACRAVFARALAFARTPADHARIVEAAGIDGTYWFDDMVAIAEARAALPQAA